MDTKGYGNMDRFGFDSSFEKPILNLEKTQTLRKRDKENLKKGDEFVVRLSTGEEIGIAKLEQKETLTVKEVLERDFDGHYTYSSLEELNERLSEYYSKKFSLNDTMTLFTFQLVTSF
jgi:hypothetical protein